MFLSLSLLWALATLPPKFVWLIVQYYTVGTPYVSENTKSSLSKTLVTGLFNHMCKHLTVKDSYVVYADGATTLNRLERKFRHLPGYLEQYTEQEYFMGRSYWLTKNMKSPDSPIILYLHGGCFGFQMNDMQLQSLANIYSTFKEEHDVELSILLMDYSLTCMGYTYPTQINETNEVYDKLVADGYTNIVVVGDSAGGNLAANLLADLNTRKTAVWPKGTVAISPYLNISGTEYTGSAKKNGTFDTFPFNLARDFGNAYIGGDEFLNLSAMVNIEANCDKVDWKNNPAIKNGDILVLYGGDEMIADQVSSWCDKIGLAENHPERIVFDLHGTHISIFINEIVGYRNLAEWKKQFWTGAVLLFFHEKFDA